MDDRRGETLEKDLNNGLALRRPGVSVHSLLTGGPSPNFTEDTWLVPADGGAKIG